jgi:transglutaminase-like putative cysteine protease
MIALLLRGRRPPQGWLASAATLAASLCFPLAVHAGQWVDGSGVLVALGLAGGLCGGWLATRRPRDRVVWLLGLLLGALVVFTTIGQTLPPLAFLLHAARSVETTADAPHWIAPALRWLQWLGGTLWLYGRELVLRSGAFGTQIGRWVYTVLSGGVSRDNDIFLLLVGWASWVSAFHVVAAFTRRRTPGAALTPAGLAVTTAVAAGRGGAFWHFTFLGLAVMLWSYGALMRREKYWLATGIGYSHEIRFDVALTGMLLGSVTFATALALAVGIPWAGTVLRRPLAAPARSAAVTLDRLFAGVRQPPGSGGGWGAAEFRELPLSRVLAEPPELRDDPVLSVALTAPVADTARLYWRGMTYDTYTGHGWANSTHETTRRAPALLVTGHSGRETVQHVRLLTDDAPVSFAVAQPVRVDVAATWVTRGGDDLIAWRTDARAYTVTSRPTLGSVAALRAAPTNYPDWVLERYLQLPERLPQAVRDYAHATTADAPTAYDKALAIEAALRRIDYSLEVGPPPPDLDVVAHFLFEMDAGYCDYFATTMAVLVRAAGVPARLATGYATGTYDAGLDAYVVTGLDAHAWVEVFFPEVGWVPFEPTPARPVIERAAPSAGVDTSAGAPATVAGSEQKQVWPIVLLGALALAGALALRTVRSRRWATLTPGEQVVAAYDDVWRWAGHFGWVSQPSETAWEQIARLQAVLAARALNISLAGRRFAWHGADVASDLRQLGAVFVKAQYGRQPLSEADLHAVREAGRRIRRRLPLLWRS